MEKDEIQVVTPEINDDIEINLEEEVATPEPTAPQEPDWKAEALKYKAIAQRYAKKKESGTPEPKQELVNGDDDIRKTVANLSLAETKRQFGYEHGLSPEEADAVFRINPKPSKETLEDPFVKGGLQAIRAKKRLADNTPSSSPRSVKPLAFKPDASIEERQKAHEDWTKNWTRKR